MIHEIAEVFPLVKPLQGASPSDDAIPLHLNNSTSL